jgi:hypothetical protein
MRTRWTSLLKRVFAADLLSATPGVARCILAIVPDGDASRAILEHLDHPTEPPSRGAV